jgi:DNA replication protein DnaC
VSPSSHEDPVVIHLFQVVSRRYDRGSIVLTATAASVIGIFADTVVATAIVDRLLHTAAVNNIQGHSYRMCSYNDQAGSGRSKGADATVR